MRKFFARFNPVSGARDFASEFSRPTPHKWQILGVSMAATFFVFMVFIPDDQPIKPRSPDVTYITTFAADRTDEEIIASNIANQERQDKRRAEIEAREERKREIYRSLGRASGIDVDEMEREIAEEQAAEEAANERARQAARERASQVVPKGESQTETARGAGNQ